MGSRSSYLDDARRIHSLVPFILDRRRYRAAYQKRAGTLKAGADCRVSRYVHTHMNFIRSEKFRFIIAFLIGAAVGVLYFMSVLTANADTVSGVSIAGNGQVIVKGAHVVSVIGNDIRVSIEWGNTRMQWTVVVSGTSRLTPARDHEALSDDIRPGQIIGFSGLLDQRASSVTVLASSVRNESILQSAAVLDGSIIESSSDGWVVQTDTGTSTIRVSSGTIMTKDGNRASLGDLELGARVKAFGTFNAKSRVLDAQRIVSISLPGIPNTGAPQKTGFLAAVAAWLGLKGGTLSVR